MGSPSFWEDNRRAQELTRERTDLARTIGRVKELASQSVDLGVMLELAEEAGDGSLDADITQGITRLSRELDERARGRAAVPVAVPGDPDQARGHVLELGCGTGRIYLPLGRAGVPLVGIDRSERMLARARQARGAGRIARASAGCAS